MIAVFGIFVIMFGVLFVVVGSIGLKKLPEGPNPIMLECADYSGYSNEEKAALLRMGDEMRKLAAIIRGGAKAFIRIQFRTVALVALIMGLIFTMFLEKWSGPAFVLGAAMSSLSIIVGLSTSTLANVRVAERARSGRVGWTIWVALKGGGVIGVCVQTFGTLGILIIYLLNPLSLNEGGHGIIKLLTCNESIMRYTSYSLGCSLVAMFSRVAGGIFTKAADMAADIVGKVLFGFVEDDAKNPATLADFVGDNVSDIAGNCPDLLESYVATIVSALAAVVFYFSALQATGVVVNEELFAAMSKFPIIFALCGLLSSIVGLIIILCRKNMSENPGKEINLVTYVAAFLTLGCAFVVSYKSFGTIDLPTDFKLGWVSLFVTASIGIISGVIIGKATEYYTSERNKPTKDLTEVSWLGPAFLQTMVDSLGSVSTVTALVLAVSVYASSYIAGSYGVSIAALGMLSFVGATLSIDAFGPICDNAGGIVESCKLPHECRQTTDVCDAEGNTTAAEAKGLAIGAAAFAAISLNVTFASAYGANLSLTDPGVVIGGIIGAVAIYYFQGLLLRDTLGGAEFMAEGAIEQLADGEIILGKREPDYFTGIIETTKYAQKKTIIPSMLCIVAIIALGISLGGEVVGGVLYGMTLSAIVGAIYMGNSGGAADNNKKYIESGEFTKSRVELVIGGGKEAIKRFLDEDFVEDDLEANYPLVEARAEKIFGEGSEVHKTSVVGDTVGDPRKDVVGVSFDIFIKMSSTTAVIFAPMFRSLAGNVAARIVVAIIALVVLAVAIVVSKLTANNPKEQAKKLKNALAYSDQVRALQKIAEELRAKLQAELAAVAEERAALATERAAIAAASTS